MKALTHGVMQQPAVPEVFHFMRGVEAREQLDRFLPAVRARDSAR
jgi:hypothetical protein